MAMIPSAFYCHKFIFRRTERRLPVARDFSTANVPFHQMRSSYSAVNLGTPLTDYSVSNNRATLEHVSKSG